MSDGTPAGPGATDPSGGIGLIVLVIVIVLLLLHVI